MSLQTAVMPELLRWACERDKELRNGRRFARALIADTLEGNTFYREAFHMLGISRESTFRELSTQLGYPS